jgi:hypothetical protein
MLFLFNIAAFEIAWFSSVFGGAREMPWLGPVAVLIVLAVHLHVARKPFEEVLLVLSCALIGATFDSVLVAAGWVSYKAGLFSNYFAPYWIIAMWMLFQKLGGIVFNHEFAALLTLAIGWAVIMPILIWLAENLDGMPGRRRNWIAERIR